MSDDTRAARDTEARLALADRMDEEAAEIDDPMCSYLDAVALLREGAAALRSIPAAAALLREAGWKVSEPGCCGGVCSGCNNTGARLD